MNIAELFARIGLKTDEDKAKSFSRAMTTVKVGLIATTAVAAGTALAIRKITGEAMDAAVAFKQFETETGASAQELQKWQAVALQTNQSAESVSSAIKAITSNQEKIKLGQGDISGYQILGIDPRQDPFKILEDLRTKTKGLSEGMKKNILSQIGVGAGMLQTLNLSNKEFDEMAGRAWIISPKAVKTLTETKSAMDMAGKAISYMKAQIAVGLSPQIKKITKQFQEWMKVNEKGIVEGFKKGFKYLTMFIKAVYNAGAAINHIVSGTIGWEYAMYGLVGAILAMNAAFSASPIGLIIAGIIILVAVLDDLYSYSQGNESLFGSMMAEFPRFKKLLDNIFGIIKDVFGAIKEVFAAISGFMSGGISLDKLIDDWGLFGVAIAGVGTYIEAVSKFWSAMLDIFNGEMSFDKLTEDWGAFGQLIADIAGYIEGVIKFWKKMIEIFSGEITLDKLVEEFGTFGKVISDISGYIDSVIKMWNGMLEILSGDISIGDLINEKLGDLDIKGMIKEKLGGFDLFGLFSDDKNLSQPKTNNVGGSSTTQTNYIKIEVNGSGDPTATGDAVANALQRTINGASAQLPRNE